MPLRRPRDRQRTRLWRALWSGVRLVDRALREPHRVLVYLTPCAGWFLASFALGERAVAAARESDLPAAVVAQIEGARKHAEGRGVRLEVRSADDLCAVRTLAAIKRAH